jgi:hypothetical protein
VHACLLSAWRAPGGGKGWFRAPPENVMPIVARDLQNAKA